METQPTPEAATSTKSELIEPLGCSHVWELRQSRYGAFYLCIECEMELSVDQYEAVKQAHHAGWDRCKRNVLELVKQQRNDQRFTPFEMRLQYADKLATAISAMTP